MVFLTHNTQERFDSRPHTLKATQQHHQSWRAEGGKGWGEEIATPPPYYRSYQKKHTHTHTNLSLPFDNTHTPHNVPTMTSLPKIHTMGSTSPPPPPVPVAKQQRGFTYLGRGTRFFERERVREEEKKKALSNIYKNTFKGVLERRGEKKKVVKVPLGSLWYTFFFSKKGVCQQLCFLP